MLDQKGLELVLSELSELTERPRLSKTEQRKHSYLLSVAAAIRSGATLASIDADRHNEYERRAGLRPTQFDYATERRAQAAVWRDEILRARTGIEYRDEVVGAGRPDYYNGSTGSFAPRDFFAKVRNQQKWYDPLVDGDVVTVIETQNGRPLQHGYYDDSANVASVVGENSDQSGNETDLANPIAVDLRAYSYRSPLWRGSLEALNDLDAMGNVMDFFQVFASQRMGLGVGRDLVSGSGVNKPLGLLTSLQTLASNCEAGVISGGSESTGGAQSGSNSIGVSDLQRLYNSIDQASLVSPKCAWLMNSSTRQFIGSIIDKVGRNLNLIEYRDGKEYIFGKPLYIAPSLPSLGSAAIPIIFGDLSAWVTRHAVDGNRIQFFFQAPGLAEKGEFGIRLFERWDGALMANGFSTTPPIKVLINHS